MNSQVQRSTLASYTYTLGPAGNRTSVAELSGRTVGYGYDSLYRLTSESITADPHGKNGTVGYTYDAVGNRQQMTSTLNAIPAGLFNYNANDQLTIDTYDNNGNTTASAGIQNTYDFENHLIQHGGATIGYDGDGNRVSETVGGVTTNYLVDTQNTTGYAQVVEELQNGTVTRRYSYGLERISETQPINSTLTTSFYGYDGHGSVRYLTNSAGTVTDTYDYDAFGNLINSTGSTPNNYLFAGEQYDPNLGVYYNRARYLNTSTGRFLTMDTDEGEDALPFSLHKYLYVCANPVNEKDISGHSQLLEAEETEADEDTIGAAEDGEYQSFLRFLSNAGKPAVGSVIATGLKAGITLTLAGALLLGSVAPLFTGNTAESEDLLLRNGHNTDDDRKAIFAFGNKTAPRAPRIGKDIHPDANGMVGPTNPPEGASAFADVTKSGLTGPFHGITLGDVWAADGLSAVADGRDVKVGSTNPETHYTIFPTRQMGAQEFIDKFLNLPWQLAGSQ
jgi:RHS repeat-associated protein